MPGRREGHSENTVQSLGASKKDARWWRRLSDAQATILAALVAVLPSITTGVATYIAKPERETVVRRTLLEKIPSRSGWTPHSYPLLGLAFLAPSSWVSDDAAARVAGGDADVIKRYEGDSGAAIGVQFRVQSVQLNYINAPNKQVANQLDVDRTRDPDASVHDAVVGGWPAKLFEFSLPTGQRRGEVRRYWLRLIPEVQLEILAFIYEDSPDREEFWSEVDILVDTVVIDSAEFQRRRELTF